MSDLKEPEPASSETSQPTDTNQSAASELNDSTPSQKSYRFYAQESMITHGTVLPPSLMRGQSESTGYQDPREVQLPYGSQDQFYYNQQHTVPHPSQFVPPNPADSNQFIGDQVLGPYYPINQANVPVNQGEGSYWQNQCASSQPSWFDAQNFPISSQQESSGCSAADNRVRNPNGFQYQNQPTGSYWQNQGAIPGQPKDFSSNISNQAQEFVPQSFVAHNQQISNGKPVEYSSWNQNASFHQQQFVPQNSPILNQPESCQVQSQVLPNQYGQNSPHQYSTLPSSQFLSPQSASQNVSPYIQQNWTRSPISQHSTTNQLPTYLHQQNEFNAHVTPPPVQYRPPNAPDQQDSNRSQIPTGNWNQDSSQQGNVYNSQNLVPQGFSRYGSRSTNDFLQRDGVRSTATFTTANQSHFEQIARRIEQKVDESVKEMKIMKEEMMELTRAVRELVEVNVKVKENEKEKTPGSGRTEHFEGRVEGLGSNMVLGVKTESGEELASDTVNDLNASGSIVQHSYSMYSMFDEKEFPVLGKIPPGRKQKTSTVDRETLSDGYCAITFSSSPRPVQDGSAESRIAKHENNNLARSHGTLEAQKCKAQQPTLPPHPCTKSSLDVKQQQRAVDAPIKPSTSSSSATTSESRLSTNKTSRDNNRRNIETQGSRKQQGSGCQESSRPDPVAPPNISKSTEKTKLAVKASGGRFTSPDTCVASCSSVVPKVNVDPPQVVKTSRVLEMPAKNAVTTNPENASTATFIPESKVTTVLEVSKVSDIENSAEIGEVVVNTQRSTSEQEPSSSNTIIASSGPELSETEPSHLTNKQKRQLALELRMAEKEQKLRERAEKEARNRAINEAKRQANSTLPLEGIMEEGVEKPEIEVEAEPRSEPVKAQKEAKQEDSSSAVTNMANISREDAKIIKKVLDELKNFENSGFARALLLRVTKYAEKQKIFRRTPAFKTVTANQTKLQSILMYTKEKHDRFKNSVEPNMYFQSRMAYYSKMNESHVVELLYVLMNCKDENIQWDHFCLAEAIKELGERGMDQIEHEYFNEVNGVLKVSF